MTTKQGMAKFIGGVATVDTGLSSITTVEKVARQDDTESDQIEISKSGGTATFRNVTNPASISSFRWTATGSA